MSKWLKNIGPGPLVAAAFIGPGTVTVCTIAGVQFGLDLLWAMVFSIVATIVLQEMAARLGIVTQKGLADVLQSEIKNKLAKRFLVLLVLSAIVVGNTAYEAGNISGAVLGLEAVFGKINLQFLGFSINLHVILVGILAFLLLFQGSYKLLEKVLLAMVILMSVSFLAVAVVTRPNIVDIIKGIIMLKSPEGSLMTIVGLIGTTVVPYNLFLHASLAKEKWKDKESLKFARIDTGIAVVLGGMVSMCVIIAASAVNGLEVTNASDLAKSLEPLFGSFSKYVISVGLFAAGITSAITAPLAAAYVACGCFGWPSNLKSIRFKVVWSVVLLVGVLVSMGGFNLIEIIRFAQFSNGLLLPLIAGFLLWAMNRATLLGTYKNSMFQNSMGMIILVVTILLGLKSILKVLQVV
ncbi:Nramp family divalent metal transporter [Mangrovimonas sp. YM274]|uniref:Nramp family divalent metal transporter n=1 Tax=Mangrovimonas sp. YM274 TaxID=3070660 RepID=UPI0027DDA9F8|nr:Nramp family divalent metal transporter [Mangrovimonas sp. YM274]WMI67543.1 Nramp family divalent metal transporter [Mangrovimonas sp. YM274]